MSLVVFTDLDGTLLDHHTYSHAPARPALAALKAAGAALVPCSSKTRAELVPLWRELGLAGPLVSENGGGVFLPAGHALAALAAWRPAGEGWLGLALSLDILEVRRRLASFAGRFGARGFGQMTDAEVAGLTGLDLAAAALARRREFDEPVLLPDPGSQGADFAAAAQAAGLTAARGGRFWHVLSGADKGRAVTLLAGLYRRLHPDLVTAGLGDAMNDAPLLRAVDRPFLVAKPDGSHAPLDLPGLTRTTLPGPAGFNQAVLGLLDEVARP
ncbi:MAG: HAD-IIB family hydrolase [Thermodesulfobacteriota bacterium]